MTASCICLFIFLCAFDSFISSYFVIVRFHIVLFCLKKQFKKGEK